MKNNKGFTLIELLIVIAIMGVLATLSYPSYVTYVERGNRGDAVDSLLDLTTRMEVYFGVNDTYVGATVNATGTGTVGSNKTSDDLYTLSIPSATAFGYTVTATPKTANTVCSTLSLNHLGQKSATGSGAAKCW